MKLFIINSNRKKSKLISAKSKRGKFYQPTGILRKQFILAGVVQQSIFYNIGTCSSMVY